MRVVLVGGHPKGRSVPFAIDTTSGWVLRRMVEKIGLDAVYFDIWKTEEEEKTGKVSDEVIKELGEYITQGRTIVALGTRVQIALAHHDSSDPKVVNLPHPAARAAKDIGRLRKGLMELYQKPDVYPVAGP